MVIKSLRTRSKQIIEPLGHLRGSGVSTFTFLKSISRGTVFEFCEGFILELFDYTINHKEWNEKQSAGHTRFAKTLFNLNIQLMLSKDAM